MINKRNSQSITKSFHASLLQVAFVKNVLGKDVNSQLLVQCLGVTSLLGRLIFGLVADRPWVNRILLQQVINGGAAVHTHTHTYHNHNHNQTSHRPLWNCDILVMRLYRNAWCKHHSYLSHHYNTILPSPSQHHTTLFTITAHHITTPYSTTTSTTTHDPHSSRQQFITATENTKLENNIILITTMKTYVTIIITTAHHTHHHNWTSPPHLTPHSLLSHHNATLITTIHIILSYLLPQPTPHGSPSHLNIIFITTTPQCHIHQHHHHSPHNTALITTMQLPTLTKSQKTRGWLMFFSFLISVSFNRNGYWPGHTSK